MAGEDPGVATLSVLLDLVQKAGSAALGSVKAAGNVVKAVANGALELYKIRLYTTMRTKMMGLSGQEAPVHGKQSLASLRRQEEKGATLASMDIGSDRKGRRALEKELDRQALDYAITKESSGDYTLHYLASNEKDVLLAMQHALDVRFDELSGPAIEEIREQNRQREAERNDPSRQQPSREWHDQSPPPLTAVAATAAYVQPEGAVHEHGRAEQATSTRMEKAERVTSHTPKAQSVADTIRLEARQQKRRDQRGAPIQTEPTSRSARAVGEPHAAAERAHQTRMERRFSREPIQSLIKQAKERSQDRNRTRKQERDLDPKRDRNRTLSRHRSRSYEMGR